MDHTTLKNLFNEFPKLADFVKLAPHGLLYRDLGKNDKVTILMTQTFCILETGSLVEPAKLVPHLVRLEAGVTSGMGLGNPEELTIISELPWFYSFAQTKKMFKCQPAKDLLTDNLFDQLLKISTQLRSKQHLDEFESMQSTILDQFRIPTTRDSVSSQRSFWFSAWEDAKNSSSYLDFLSRLNIQIPNGATLNFSRLDKPKKRIVINQWYGEIHGVLVSEGFEDMLNVEDLRVFAEWKRRNPIVFADHDQDRPIGLAVNPHVRFNEKSKKHEVYTSTAIFCLNHWKNIGNYKGFSYSAYREP